MITAKFDRPKTEASLRKFAAAYGETAAQAVVRWSIQVCRELAFETQVYGKKGARKKQEGAMYADALNVLYIDDNATKGRRFLGSPEQVIDWIEMHRLRRGRRTSKLPYPERKICSRATLEKAMRIKMKNAGIAKGGWVGAGVEIAKAQTGQDKISIGKNFLGYAQKHSHFGSAKKPSKVFSPVATVTNRASGVGNEYVMKRSAVSKAMNFGLQKTVKFYKKALAALDKKKL